MELLFEKLAKEYSISKLEVKKYYEQYKKIEKEIQNFIEKNNLNPYSDKEIISKHFSNYNAYMLWNNNELLPFKEYLFIKLEENRKEVD